MTASRLFNGLCLGILVAVLAACGGSSSSGGGGGTTPAGNAAVTIKVVFDATNSGKYDPNPGSAKVGDIVEWDFNDDQNGPHTATSDDGSTFNSQDKVTGNKGDKYQFTFTKAGTFPYHCTFHANMKGSITVQ